MENWNNSWNGRIKRNKKYGWILAAVAACSILIGGLTGLITHGFAMKLFFCIGGLALTALCALLLHVSGKFDDAEHHVAHSRVLHGVMLHALFTCAALLAGDNEPVLRYAVPLSLAFGALAATLIFCAGTMEKNVGRPLFWWLGLVMGVVCCVLTFIGDGTLLWIALIAAAFLLLVEAFLKDPLRRNGDKRTRVTGVVLACLVLMPALLLLCFGSSWMWLHMLLHTLFLLGGAGLAFGMLRDINVWLARKNTRRNNIVIYYHANKKTDMPQTAPTNVEEKTVEAADLKDAELNAVLDEIIAGIVADEGDALHTADDDAGQVTTNGLMETNSADTARNDETERMETEPKDAVPVAVIGAAAITAVQASAVEKAMRASPVESTIAMNLNGIVRDEYRPCSIRELKQAPMTAFVGVSEHAAINLKKAFGVDNIGELAALKYVRWAQDIQTLASREA